MKEHPEDRKMRKEGELFGRLHAKQFVERNLPMVIDTIGLYADDDARELFEHLREIFWSVQWNTDDEQ